jgi:hypothetical protein
MNDGRSVQTVNQKVNLGSVKRRIYNGFQRKFKGVWHQVSCACMIHWVCIMVRITKATVRIMMKSKK